MLAVLRPELKCYLWQSEVLMQLGGYLDPHDMTNRSLPSVENPFFLCLPAANGSGKDLVIIAAFAVWFALKGLHNFIFITSSSHEQVKTQTNPHIRELCQAANKRLGNIFRSVENYHVCTQTASEIKLFVTDEAGRAEGFHPRFGGELAMIFNEAKTIEQDLWSAYMRCTGYSYWLEISSPGGKSGHFYESAQTAIMYPNQPQLGKYYRRHISAYDCPHIPKHHIELAITRQTKEWVDSSINALFTDYGISNVIKESLWDSAAIQPIAYITDDSYAIGGDLAAGGDECSFYARKGPNLIDEMHFRQSDTTLTAEIFDTKFAYLKNKENLIVNLDDGGIGHAIIDQIKLKGWTVRRINNQSAAVNKREFLNIGAEMYFKLARLLSLRLIQSSGKRDALLRRQVTSRLADNLNGGKFRLEPKKDHITRHHESPDRSDAYVLTYKDYPIEIRESNDIRSSAPLQSFADFEEALTWGNLGKFYGNNAKLRPSSIRSI